MHSLKQKEETMTMLSEQIAMASNLVAMASNLIETMRHQQYPCEEMLMFSAKGEQCLQEDSPTDHYAPNP